MAEGWTAEKFFPRAISPQTRKTFISDLQTAKTMAFFELRVRCLQEAGENLPPNIEQLRVDCRNREGGFQTSPRCIPPDEREDKWGRRSFVKKLAEF